MVRLLIGRVGRPHGVRGECKIVPDAEDADRYVGLERLFVGHSSVEAAEYGILSLRRQLTRRGPIMLVRLRGVTTPEQASGLSGMAVFAAREDLPPLEEGEFFVHDLVGLEVRTYANESVGTMKEVWPAPASDIYVVARPGMKDVLIPAVPAFIECVDLARSRITVRPIEGMLE